MSIDWITVAAQIVNFLLLLYLLKRFLYQPILNGIDAREADIAKRMADADAAQQAANKAEVTYKKLQADHLAKQGSLLEQALQTTEKERERLLAETRAQLLQEQEKWQQHFEQERTDFIKRLQQAGASTLFTLTQKALRDLADEPLEAAMVRQVSGKLQGIQESLQQAAGEQVTAVVSSHFALTDTVQKELVQALIAVLPQADVQFQVDPEQALGVLVQIGGVRVEWTIASYMDEFEALLAENTAATQVGGQRQQQQIKEQPVPHE